jgi:multidrug efflux pump subunit AcrA (membrane-fusion protein)
VKLNKKILYLVFIVFLISGLILADNGEIKFINTVAAQGTGGGQGGGAGRGAAGTEDDSETLVAVETIKSRTGDFTDRITVNAQAEAANEVEVMPRIQEVVNLVNVKIGDRVETGDILIEMDNRNNEFDILNANASLKKAEADLQSALNGAKTEEIEQKEAQLAQAESELKLREENYRRKEQLFNEEYISKQELDQAANEFTAARSNYLTALKSLELIKMGASEEEIAALESQVAQAEVNLARARLNSSYSKVSAPISGIVADLNAELGQLLSNQRIAVITNIDQIELLAFINELNVNKLITGEEVRVSFRSLKREFMGVIASISPRTADNRQSFPVRIIVENPDNIIKSGMTAQVELITARAEDVILLNQNAVLEDNGIKYVFILKDGKVKKQEIEISDENEDIAVIKSGLEAEQEVVTTGKENLKDGMAVNVVNRGDN